MKAWPDKPKGLSERSYRKYMARHKKVKINGKEYELQSVSPQWYMNVNDECGMTGGKRDTARYIDEMFKNVVVAPPEIKEKGIEYFNETEDIDSTEKLLKEVESFLRERK